MADRDIPREAGEETRPTEGQPEVPRLRRSTDDTVVAGIALVALGLMLLIDAFVPWFDRLMWSMVVLAAGLALIYTGVRRGRG